MKFFIVTNTANSENWMSYVEFKSLSFIMFPQRFHWFKGQKTLNYSWIKIFHKAKYIFLFTHGMPCLFTHGKLPAVNPTSVLPHLKVFSATVDRGHCQRQSWGLPVAREVITFRRYCILTDFLVHWLMSLGFWYVVGVKNCCKIVQH